MERVKGRCQKEHRRPPDGARAEGRGGHGARERLRTSLGKERGRPAASCSETLPAEPGGDALHVAGR